MEADVRARARDLLETERLHPPARDAGKVEALGHDAQLALESIEESLYELAVLWRIEEACAFAWKHVSVGFEDARARELLVERIRAILEIVRARPSPRHRIAPVEANAAGAPAKIAAVEATIRRLGSDPSDQLYVTLLTALGAARAPIHHREPTLTLEGRVAWVPSGSVRALVLWSLMEARTAAARAFPALAGLFARKTTTFKAPASPFRTAPVVRVEVSDIPLERWVDANTDGSRLRAHLERAGFLSAIVDAWHNMAEAGANTNPFGACRLDRLEDRGTVLTLTMDELAAARSTLVGGAMADRAFAALEAALELAMRWAVIRKEERVESDMRRVLTALDELGAALANGWGFERSLRTALGRAFSGAFAQNARPGESALETVVRALAQEAPTVPNGWRWSDLHLLAYLGGEGGLRAPWWDRLRRASGRGADDPRAPPPSRSGQRALRRYIDELGEPLPTAEDHRVAALLVDVLARTSPPALVYFSIPSAKYLVSSIARVTSDAFIASVRGIQETEVVMRFLLSQAVRAFGPRRPFGQLLERWVERHLYARTTSWTEAPTFDTEY